MTFLFFTLTRDLHTEHAEPKLPKNFVTRVPSPPFPPVPLDFFYVFLAPSAFFVLSAKTKKVFFVPCAAEEGLVRSDETGRGYVVHGPRPGEGQGRGRGEGRVKDA